MRKTIKLPSFWHWDIDSEGTQINHLVITVSEECKKHWVWEIARCVSYALKRLHLPPGQITIKLTWIDEGAAIKNIAGKWKFICYGAKYIYIDKDGMTLDGIFQSGELPYIDDIYDAILNLEDS